MGDDMRFSTLIGWTVLGIGLLSVYAGLYSSDSLPLLQSAVLHFFEHMQMMWDDMPPDSKIYVLAGTLALPIGATLLLFSIRK